MSKDIWTPRAELICGKIDEAEKIASELGSVELMDLLKSIRYDAERMEKKLILRKKQVSVLIKTHE